MAERRFTGQPASPGLALGPIHHIETKRASSERRQGSPEQERSALKDAIANAMADLEALAAVAQGDGAEILAFQIEMLADPALVEDVLPLINAGEDAASAWRQGIDEQILIYESADDDYFRARASDLRDLADRVDRILAGASLDLPNLPAGALLLAEDLAPSHFLALVAMEPAGIALTRGSKNSHIAILARGRGLPMVVGLAADAVVDATSTGEAILDGDAGLLLTTPTASTLQHYREKLSAAAAEAERAAALRGRPAVTADGTGIDVLINVDDPAAIDDDILKAADGVGLLRTEFLLIGRDSLPDEDEQFQVYADLQRRLDGKPLVIRTFDIGGDKPLAGLDLPTEANPFLGLRGIRLYLDRPDLFKPQLRALLRAATLGSLQVMLPMVTVQAEIDQTRSLMAEALSDLTSAGVDAAMPPLGIMVETPAAAIIADVLDSDFFSIGSNDLIQYVTAAARDASGGVRDLLDPGHPAIERLIGQVVNQGLASKKEVSLCGDMASEPDWLPLLLRTGLRKISVAPAALDRVKLALSEISLKARQA
ncbi:MAG: phosphoenolpyruvate--protein phosphotransferase [Pseudomonadota bacterium]